VTCDGRLLGGADAIGNALSPMVDSRVHRTTREIDDGSETKTQDTENRNTFKFNFCENQSVNQSINQSWTFMPTTRTSRVHYNCNPRFQVRTKHGVFGNGRFNGAIQIFRGPIFVAMVTKFGLFANKIGHKSAYTNARAAEQVFFGHGQFNVVYEL